MGKRSWEEKGKMNFYERKRVNGGIYLVAMMTVFALFMNVSLPAQADECIATRTG